jgi:hypothetical protein
MNEDRGPDAGNRDHDETLSFVEAAEAALHRMIAEIFRFLFARLPTW